ncbi:hypothetical protein UFOVP787_186 [uncultured Caudovirales phage]|uniref:Uncharacterized protein n=1 Tax=uncultured Caudovirales phage TaxID=2100421 RepID=A0A6J5NT39_9CAUD|nr:hypothetical protein UFOVP787_186 [uncultured Caudovirales phage]
MGLLGQGSIAHKTNQVVDWEGLEPPMLYSGLKVRAVRHYGNQSIYSSEGFTRTMANYTHHFWIGELDSNQYLTESKADILPLNYPRINYLYKRISHRHVKVQEPCVYHYCEVNSTGAVSDILVKRQPKLSQQISNDFKQRITYSKLNKL